MDTRGGRQHLCPTVGRGARLRRPQETRADLAAGIGLGCGSGRWVRRSGVILNPLTEAGLFARPDLALHAASTGRCGGRRPLTHSKEPDTEGPVAWARPGPCNGLVPSTTPCLATKGTFILKQKPRGQTTQHPEPHRPQSPWQSSLSLPELLGPHSSTESDSVWLES